MNSSKINFDKNTFNNLIINILIKNKIDFSAFFYLQTPANCWTFESTNFQSAPKMTMHMKRLLTILWVFFLANLLHAQDGFWQELKSPYGGAVQVIPTATSIVYSTSFGRVFRSNDFGNNWVQLAIPEVDTMDIHDEVITISPTGTFYKMLTYYNGIAVSYKLFASNDEGQTWQLKDNDLQAIYIHTLPSGTLIGLNESIEANVYRSTDQGATWQIVHTTSSGLFLGYGSSLHVAKSGKAVLTSQLSAKFLITNDDGATWTIAQSPFMQGKNYILESGAIISMDDFNFGQSIAQSSDGGNNWTFIGLNLDPNDYPKDLIQPNVNKVVISTSRKLFSSPDNGLTWSEINPNPTQAHSFYFQYALPNGDILGNYKSTLVRSSNDGQDWTFSAKGITSANSNAIKAFNSENIFALTDYGLWATSDASENWNLLWPDTTNNPLSSTDPLAVLNQDSFAVKMGNKIWASVDGGQSFSNITPAGGLNRGDLFISSDGWLLCTGQQGVLQTTSFSGNWSVSMPNVAIQKFAEHTASGKWFMLTKPNDFNTLPQNLWTSDDKGQHWTLLETLDMDGAILYDLVSDAAGRIYITAYHNNAKRVAISTDTGENWTYNIIPEIYTLGELSINSLGHLFLTLYNNFRPQILTSVDQGLSWYAIPKYKTESFKVVELDEDGFIYAANAQGDLVSTSKTTESGAYIYSIVLRDGDLDCTTPDAQVAQKNWTVSLTGDQTYYGSTGQNGECVFYVDTGFYTLKTRVPQALWWSLCDSVQTVNATQPMGSDTVPFVALPLAECPLMSVNVAVPRLRRCFNNEVFVNYCNQGTEPADSAWVDVTLDEYLSFISSTQPHDSLGNNVYRFYVGNLISGECGDFNLTVYVNCDSTVLGQTHCINAHGFPDTLCTSTSSWSGANIEASVVCQDTLIQLKLENTGQAPSSTLEYIIIEDDVVLFTGQKSYAPGESILMDYDANGSTWRIESMQEPGHPFSFLALAFEEGCGGFESLGFINQFPVNGSSPSLHQICVENIGSFDPNDKQGFPTGVGEDHNIRPGQELEYLIRFQNTGTDTAFTVMIRDTLSAFLDPASVRPGASSHPYTWSLSGEGVITFTFNNIHLPDSNINEPASHGFVQFRIAQQSNLPLGSVIENDAAIYFDFNDPIITNTTWHTLYESPLMLATYEAGHNRKQQSLEIWPNPVKDQTNVRLKDASAGSKRVNLYNSTGQILQSLHFTGQETKLKCSSLAQGQYWIQVTDVQGRTLGSSVLVKE